MKGPKTFSTSQTTTEHPRHPGEHRASNQRDNQLLLLHDQPKSSLRTKTGIRAGLTSTSKSASGAGKVDDRCPEATDLTIICNGRKTGIRAPSVQRDEDGFEDVDAFFKSSPASARSSAKKRYGSSPSSRRRRDYDDDDEEEDEDEEEEEDDRNDGTETMDFDDGPCLRSFRNLKILTRIPSKEPLQLLELISDRTRLLHQRRPQGSLARRPPAKALLAKSRLHRPAQGQVLRHLQVVASQTVRPLRPKTMTTTKK